jgi:hypothetical protein
MSGKVGKINRFMSDKARRIDLRPKEVGKNKIKDTYVRESWKNKDSYVRKSSKNKNTPEKTGKKNRYLRQKNE